MNDPDDVEQCLVFADELSARGDPRGALMMLHARGLHEAAEAHLAAHATTLIPPLEALGSAVASVEWTLGFIRRLRVLGHDDAGEALPAVLAHESFRYLRALELNAMSAEVMAAGLRLPLEHLRQLRVALVDLEGSERVIDAIASKPRLLTSLDFGDGRDLAQVRNEDLPLPQTDALVSKHTLKAFSRATPKLESLTLRGHRLFKGLRHDHLERLALVGDALDGCWHDAHPVAVTLPSLTTLTVENHRATFARAALVRERLPKLRTLIFRGDFSVNEDEPSLLHTLAASEIVPQLRTLEVPALTDHDRTLVARFEHLELRVGT